MPQQRPGRKLFRMTNRILLILTLSCLFAITIHSKLFNIASLSLDITKQSNALSHDAPLIQTPEAGGKLQQPSGHGEEVERAMIQTNDGTSKESRHNPRYTPVSCSALLNEARLESQRYLAAEPRLRSPPYDPSTGQIAAGHATSNLSKSDFADVLSNVLDPNFGTTHIRPSLNIGPPAGEDGRREVDFQISLHRPEVDPQRWGIFTKGKYYELLMTDHFISLLGSNDHSGGGTKDFFSSLREIPAIKAGVVVDVGMNIGWFTLLSASLGRDVYAFDPNPIHHVRMCQSLLANKWCESSSPPGQNNTFLPFQYTPNSPHVENYQYGIGDKSGNLTLTYGLTNSGSASLRSDAQSKSFRYKVSHSVEVLTLDGFAMDKGWIDGDGNASRNLNYQFESKNAINDNGKFPQIALLKVDVEGYESAVWGGAKKLLRSGLVQTILTELTLFPKGQMSEGVVDSVQIIVGAGYRLGFVADFLGNYKAFMEDKDTMDFPYFNSTHARDTVGGNTDAGIANEKEVEKYGKELAGWIYKFALDKHKMKQVNLMWVRDHYSQ